MRRSFVLILLAIGCGSRSSLDAEDASSDTASIDATREHAVTPTKDAAIDATVDASDPADAWPMIDAEAARPCLTGGNVFHVEGDPGDSVYPATATVGPNDGRWSAVESGGLFVQISVATGAITSLSWGFAFSTITTQTPIAVGTYDPVVGPSTTTMSPTLRLVTDGRYCDQPRMRVTIADFETTGPHDEGDLVAMTATFEQHCNGATAAIRGCVRFHR